MNYIVAVEVQETAGDIQRNLPAPASHGTVDQATIAITMHLPFGMSGQDITAGQRSQGLTEDG